MRTALETSRRRENGRPRRRLFQELATRFSKACWIGVFGSFLHHHPPRQSPGMESDHAALGFDPENMLKHFSRRFQFAVAERAGGPDPPLPESNMRESRRVGLWLFLGFSLWAFCTFPAWLAAQDRSDLRQEEGEDYYRKWLNEDVVYILTPEERAVFVRLSTSEEKDQFIEQFWARRDPDPRTAHNEFKEEHYRRIAYVNEHFKSGEAGWKTDRGRIYILYGPPDQREASPMGGNYERRDYEGGGFTSVYPFERWWYRHLEGVGSDVELEFVDPRFANEYYLAIHPEEKDALLHVPGQGLTWAEEFGGFDKSQRPYFVSNYGEEYPWINYRFRDGPFQRYERYFAVQRPPVIKYPDLKELVQVNVTYDNLPFQVREDYFRLSEARLLAPVTIQFENRHFTFKENGGIHAARLAVYGLVTSLTNRIVYEFEDEVATSYRAGELEQALSEPSLYQKIVPLESRMRYRLDLVVKDLNSGKVGVQRRALIPPPYQKEELLLSSLVLSGFIRQLGGPETWEKQDDMFVLGDIWIRPSVDGRFLSHDPLGVYVQVYNAALDQAALRPSLDVNYRLLRAGETVREVSDSGGESMQMVSGQRVVLIRALSLEGLEAGTYSAEVEVRDRISGQSARVAAPFQVRSRGSAAPR